MANITIGDIDMYEMDLYIATSMMEALSLLPSDSSGFGLKDRLFISIPSEHSCKGLNWGGTSFLGDKNPFGFQENGG